MIDPSQLLAVAEELATLDKTKPREASLRRSISTAYYALFHRLILSSTYNLSGVGGPYREIGATVARWFDHAQMAKACRAFSGPLVQGKLQKALPTGYASTKISHELQEVARAFVRLQEERRRADYDGLAVFRRQDAIANIQLATQAFADWKHAKKDPFRHVFGLLLLTGDAVVIER